MVTARTFALAGLADVNLQRADKYRCVVAATEKNGVYASQ